MIYDGKWDKKTASEKLADARAELERDIARWHEIYRNGCSDPFWPDGVNLDLKRNHIIHDLRIISELEQKPVQVSFFDAVPGEAVDWKNDPRIPPRVPQDYMATDRKCHYFWGEGGIHDGKEVKAG